VGGPDGARKEPMRIALDLDGVIVDGSTYHPEERRGPALYLATSPYDLSTPGIFESLCLHHEVYIITARHYPGAFGDVVLWLQKHGMCLPAGILTYVAPEDKAAVANSLGADVFVDDHPRAFQAGELLFGGTTLLMNNPGWQENLAVATPNRVSSWVELAERIATIARKHSI
jgi:5'(3')-deoxyribonucleotidase